MVRFGNTRYAIGADIGGSHISSAVVDIVEGKVQGTPITSRVDASVSAQKIIAVWADNIRQTIEHALLDSPLFVSFAIPGPFDYKRGISMIRGVRKYENLYGLDISASLFPMLCDSGVKEFRYVNDAAAFALGECLYGSASNAKRVIALTLGTGVGSGFVSDHKLMTSGDGVPKNGWVYDIPFEDGIADEAFSTRWFCRHYFELTGIEVNGAEEVANKWGEDPVARQIFEEYGNRLAEFTAPLLKNFHADALVLGGNISLAYPFFGSELETRLAHFGLKTSIYTSKLLERAALLGAASLYL
jgi:glucokinase